VTWDGRDASVTWSKREARRLHPELRQTRGLEGDEEIIRLAVRDEALGREFAATATGPFLLADLEDAHAALVQLGSYFRSGLSVDGDPPWVVYPVGDDAVA